MKEKKYIIWIEAGCTNIAEIQSVSEATIGVTMPMCLVNSPVGEDKDGQVVDPRSPNAVKIHYHTDMVPYVFKEMVGTEAIFTLSKNATKYAVISADTNIAKQYELIITGLSKEVNK